MMSIDLIATLARELSSLDHALLLNLIAKQHCLIETTSDIIDEVAEEIQLIASQLFGLSWATVECHSETTLEDFSRDILIATEDKTNWNVPITRPITTTQRQASSYSTTKPQSSIEHNIASIVVAKDLGNASRQVQIQALELIRTNRIFTHTAVHATPKPFLFVVLASTDTAPLNVHLNEIIFLSHYHDPLDELPRLESRLDRHSVSISNPSSLSKQRSPIQDIDEAPPLATASDILHLSSLLPSINLTAETRSYLMTVVICIRTHRALIPGSATPLVTQYLELLSRCLALLHGVGFISPSIVALAARKVYRHRLRILEPSDAAWERSVMYGSKVAAVKDLLDELWMGDGESLKSTGDVAEGIINNVIASTEVPV